MGGFYGNITLRGPSQDEVVQALHGRHAAVAPTKNGNTVAFDSACDEQDCDGIQSLAARLSKKLHCIALAVIVHDDDVLIFYLYEHGTLSDAYSSSPDYFAFDPPKMPRGPVGGNPARLCTLFGHGDAMRLGAILQARPDKDKYAFETDRHRDIVHELALPEFAVGTALASFDRGEYPDGLSADVVMRAADPPCPEDPKQKADRAFYNKLGQEDSTRRCQKTGCNRGAIRFGVLCKRHHFEMIRGRECPFDD